MNPRTAVLVIIALILALCSSPQLVAQTIHVFDDAKLPRFEAASVKAGDPHPPAGGMRFGMTPIEFVQENAVLLPAVMMAFGVRPDQIAPPLPKLIAQDLFTINARVPATAAPTDRALMVRALLIDRFKLRYHVDHQAKDGYVLMVARPDGRLGPQMRQSRVDCASRLAALARKQPVDPLPAGAAGCGVRNGPGLLNLAGASIDTLVRALSNQLGAPIVDETRLTGSYDVELRFALSAADPSSTSDAPRPTRDDAPSVIAAVQKQLGLQLTRGETPVDVLVIDHIERPDPD